MKNIVSRNTTKNTENLKSFELHFRNVKITTKTLCNLSNNNIAKAIILFYVQFSNVVI